MTETNGTLIRRARRARVWSQQDLAQAAGLSYKTIWAAEADVSVRPKTLKAIGEALEIDLLNREPEEVAS